MSKILIFFCLFLSVVSWARMSDVSWEEVKKYYYLNQQVTNDPWLKYDLAMTFAYTGYLQEGFEALRVIPEIDPLFSSKVLERYSRRAQRNPESWKDKFYYAFALYFNEDRSSAIVQLTEAVPLAPDDSVRGWMYGYIAYLHGENKNWGPALEAINKAISLEPDGAALYFAKAYALSETGDKTGAAGAILVAAGQQAKFQLSKYALRNLDNAK